MKTLGDAVSCNHHLGTGTVDIATPAKKVCCHFMGTNGDEITLPDFDAHDWAIGLVPFPEGSPSIFQGHLMEISDDG